MRFRIRGLDPAPFRSLFCLSDEALQDRGVLRYRVEATSGYPDRIELRDARPGETVLLLNYVHQPAATPYRASHAIFVREGAERAFDAIDQVPDSLRSRLISLRAFSSDGMLLEGNVVEGRDLEGSIEQLLRDPAAAYLQAHNAKQGCYAARIERA